MSKTETQSEAPINKLREAFEFDLIDNHAYTAPDLEKRGGYYADDEIQFAWEMAVVAWEAAHASTSSELRRLGAENKALRERLEIDPSHPIDGIAARDETIRLLDGQILALRARLEAPAAALAAPSAGWISVDVALPPKNTEMAIWFAESTIPSTGQYTGLRADPNGWSYPSENYLSPGEHPNHPEGGYPTVTHWMELHAPGAAQAKEGGA